MLTLLLAFVAVVLLLYVLMGGADYGAGILELYAPRRFRLAQRRLINHAMGPVWEANHMWLIILVVVFFMGFPDALAVLMTSLHLPIVALLLGIVVRGTVFTFRHYDAETAWRSQTVFTVVFAAASLWSSMWLGVLAAALFRGRIDPAAKGFVTGYVAPWLGLYPLSLGIMVSLAFAFLASLYLVSETRDRALQSFFLRRAKRLNVALLACGGVVFVTAAREHNNLPRAFVNSPWALACVAAATLLAAGLWFGPGQRRLWTPRLLGAGQVATIVLGWFVVHAPYVYTTVRGPVSFAEVAAPAATLHQLVWALGVGSALILPSLAYLLYVFKRSNEDAPDSEVGAEKQMAKFRARRRPTFLND